jgi:hypothetical protein
MVMNKENLGPAERIINAIIAYSDHMVHNRPGMVTRDDTAVVGVKWTYVTHKLEEGQKVAYALDKIGKKTVRRKLGVIQDNNQVKDEAGHVIGEYRSAGIFPEVATWLYKQVAEVWKIDNEFAARWASYAFEQEHRDLKVVLAAFMLVQARKGDPVLDDKLTPVTNKEGVVMGMKKAVLFQDEDFRDIGEAMCLLQRKDQKDFNPKLLLRIRDLLCSPQIVAVNHELGFGKSARTPFLGRWPKAVQKWLLYREENPRVLEGLVKAGFRSTVMELAQRIGYKPENPRFFETLRWKQVQSKHGHRALAIGQDVAQAESWANLSEMEICERIIKEKISFKKISTMVPRAVGITRAVMSAAIESGALSDKELIMRTPTLEELGLLQVQDIRERWEKALKNAEDMRALNIATRVKSQGTKDKLAEAADTAVKKAVEESTRGLRVYVMVDVSGSMEGAIESAKEYIAKFLQGIPLDRMHVSTFNTIGREVRIQHASAPGVQNAFKGVKADGGTSYGEGVRALQGHKPKADEDVLFIFVGDEQAQPFDAFVRQSGLNPMAFGLVSVTSKQYGRGTCVRDTATALGIPCFEIDEKIFADPYAVTRTIRALVAATPVNKTVMRVAPAVRISLAETILKVDLLQKPAWAA